MPILTNVNTQNIKRRSDVKTHYVDAIGEPVPNTQGRKKGTYYFIPLVALDKDKLPKWWDNELPRIQMSDFDTATEVNTRRDLACWSAGFPDGKGGALTQYVKWVYSGLDVSLGDELSDPAVDLGLKLNGKMQKNTMGYGVDGRMFPPKNSFTTYITIPVIWMPEKNKFGHWTGGEYARVEMKINHWDSVKKILVDAEQIKYSYYKDDDTEEGKDIVFSGSAGYTAVVKLDKDTSKLKAADMYVYSLASSFINQNEVMQFVKEAYEDIVDYKKNTIIRYEAPWKVYADQLEAGEINESEATKFVVATIANKILTVFGEEYEMPTHVDRILEVYTQRIPQLSYAQGADLANAILETADGNIGNDEDGLDDEVPF